MAKPVKGLKYLTESEMAVKPSPISPNITDISSRKAFVKRYCGCVCDEEEEEDDDEEGVEVEVEEKKEASEVVSKK